MVRNYIYILTLLLLTISCGRLEDEDTVYSQTERIEKYLDADNIPYSVRDLLYIVSLSEGNKSGMPIVEQGDSVYINYAQYIFSAGLGALVSTNIDSIALKQSVPFNGDFTPFGVEYGKSDILDGLNQGLRGLSQSDSVMLFMPSDLAYRDQYIGVVEPYSSIAMFVSIEKIVKN